MLAAGKMTALSIHVREMMEIGGPSDIVYFLENKQKRLVRINIDWGKSVTDNVVGKDIVNAANLLRNYFVKKRYKKNQQKDKRKLKRMESFDVKCGNETIKHVNSVKYLGFVSGIENLNSLRNFSNLYFHGHSVGGTNPSLLEAMASNSLICAHDNIFNKSILEKDAYYFTNFEQISSKTDNVYHVFNVGIVVLKT